MDVLSDVLAISGVRGSAGARIGACGSWGVAWSADQDAALYAVTAGTAYLTPDGEPERLLTPGDVVLLPTGVPHVLSSEPGVEVHACDTRAALQARRDGGLLRFGDGEAHTQILGAGYSHDAVTSVPVLTLLPDVIHIRASAADPDLADTVRLLGRELARPRAATAVLLDRLVDVLLIQVLRAWLDSGTSPDISWWGVLRDPLLHQAVTRIHEEPARDWTTASLAREAAVSASTLNRRFLAATGETPGAYLTRWRMTLAAKHLRDTDATLEAVAEKVGYTSVYAFSRAFRRERHLPPARFRKSVSL
ncbi:AraC family transcriptional regulator [Actinoplanes sp. NBRC 101535]|uniref:AraC family transcriptional regulator n=1 Tax=Actinoplanes sp. NBRC 101535 TaxID=3032196 RepID=UPI00255634D0|nr:AraC family transcriptional regulator [Actinoplanes sp. NBRC 101535]